MAHVLLTGGTGFLAGHVLERLVNSGYKVVTTVRSQPKGEQLLRRFPTGVSFAIVKDVAKEGAFNEVLKSNPTVEYVIHTASPFHFNYTDAKTEMLDPAIQGTSGILKSVQQYATQVKRVVFTSSFVAIMRPGREPEVYNETHWNPVTYEEGLKGSQVAYIASKKLAEEAAWDFLKQEEPRFSLTAICPPLILGPPSHLDSLEKSVNTSNQMFLALLQGAFREQLPPSPAPMWVDVRDVADAHVHAMTIPAAANERFLVVGGINGNRDIANIVRAEFPALGPKLPLADSPSDLPLKVPGYDSSKAKNVLGVTFRPLQETVVDTVNVLLQRM